MSASQLAPAPIQANLSFEPIVIHIGTPPHNPLLVSKLKPATLHALALLMPGRPVTRLELQSVAGARYSARLGELRAAGYHILGPTRWRDSEGNWVADLEPARSDGMEMYRMVRGR